MGNLHVRPGTRALQRRKAVADANTAKREANKPKPETQALTKPQTVPAGTEKRRKPSRRNIRKTQPAE